MIVFSGQIQSHVEYHTHSSTRIDEGSTLIATSGLGQTEQDQGLNYVDAILGTSPTKSRLCHPI
jgi:hypothetical protein